MSRLVGGETNPLAMVLAGVLLERSGMEGRGVRIGLVLIADESGRDGDEGGTVARCRSLH